MLIVDGTMSAFIAYSLMSWYRARKPGKRNGLIRETSLPRLGGPYLHA